MPLPIICASDQLCQYLALFRAVFSKPQWQYFVTVLLALLQSEDRRTLSGLLRKVVAGVSLAGLSRFFARAPWDETTLSQLWLTHFCTTMKTLVQAEHQRQRAVRPKRRGLPKATLVTSYLVLDDSTHVKPKGRKMEGLGWHHSTTDHRRVKGHSLFIALWVLLGRHCPLAPRLYRTRTVCQKEGVAFQSKIDLAAQLLETVVPLADTHTHVLMDAWYSCKRLWTIARARGFACSGGVKSNRQLRRHTPAGQRYWQTLSAFAGELLPVQFQGLTWPAQDGGRTVYVHSVRTLVHRLGACQVVIVRERVDAPLQETRYFVTSLLEADAQIIINHLAVRWDIETLFADLKELFGSDHYQLMTARAIVRFWTLGCCAYFFLDGQRAAKSISIGQTRRDLQATHQFNLLEWLSDEFQRGRTPAQIQTELA